MITPAPAASNRAPRGNDTGRLSPFRTLARLGSELRAVLRVHWPWMLLFIPLGAMFWNQIADFWATWVEPASATWFVPLVPLGVLALAWRERAEVRRVYEELALLFPADSPKRRGSLIPLLFGCALLLFSSLIAVPDLALLAFPLVLVSVVYYVHGLFVLRALASAALFFFIGLFPIPKTLIGITSAYLQIAQTTVAGGILQVLRPGTRVQGTTILLPGYGLDVSGASSGINTLIPLLMAALWLAFWRRLHWTLSLALLAAAFLLAIFTNVLRLVVTGVVAGFDTDAARFLHDANGVVFTLLAFYPLYLLSRALPKLGGGPRGLSMKEFERDQMGNAAP